jgi:transposase-like protein
MNGEHLPTTALQPGPSVGGRLDLESLVREVESQPELFDAPEDREILAEAKRSLSGGIFAFTGSTVQKDERRALQIAILRLSGTSKREIARRIGCSRNVIDAVIEQLERAGKIEPLKDRLPRLLGAMAEDAAERARDLIHDGDISNQTAGMLKSLGVLAGIGADKSAAAQSISGDLHLHQHVHLGDADPLRDYLSQRAQALATESNAGGSAPKSLSGNGASDLAAGVAAGSGAVVEVEATIEAPDPTGFGPDQAAADDRGAGGVGDARGASHL